jgi:predicted acylesterase/phospholipase RssA
MMDCIKRDYDNTVLVLQGGGALGAYQAGVYEGLAEAGYAPDWVTGVPGTSAARAAPGVAAPV